MECVESMSYTIYCNSWRVDIHVFRTTEKLDAHQRSCGLTLELALILPRRLNSRKSTKTAVADTKIRLAPKTNLKRAHRSPSLRGRRLKRSKRRRSSLHLQVKRMIKRTRNQRQIPVQRKQEDDPGIMQLQARRRRSRRLRERGRVQDKLRRGRARERRAAQTRRQRLHEKANAFVYCFGELVLILASLQSTGSPI